MQPSTASADKKHERHLDIFTRLYDHLVMTPSHTKPEHDSLWLFLKSYVQEFELETHITSNMVKGSRQTLFHGFLPANDSDQEIPENDLLLVPIDISLEVEGQATAPAAAAFLSALLTFLPKFQEQKRKRSLNIIIFTNGFYHSQNFCDYIDTLASKTRLPRTAWIVMPTHMQPALEHKGVYGFSTEVIGHGTHAAIAHEGVNAIGAASELIGYIQKLGKELKDAASTHSGPQYFDPPYSTVNIGSIRGGHDVHHVPERCVFEWEFRTIPGIDMETIYSRLNRYVEEAMLPRMNAFSDIDCQIETSVLYQSPPLDPVARSKTQYYGALKPYLSYFQNAAPLGLSASSIGGLLQRQGIPCWICGPGQPNHRYAQLKIEEIYELFDFLDFYAQNLG